MILIAQATSEPITWGIMAVITTAFIIPMILSVVYIVGMKGDIKVLVAEGKNSTRMAHERLKRLEEIDSKNTVKFIDAMNRNARAFERLTDCLSGNTGTSMRRAIGGGGNDDEG